VYAPAAPLQPPAPQAGPIAAPAGAPQSRLAEQAQSGASLPPSILESVEADPSLRVVVLPNSASLRVETADGQDLSVHLRVRDGVANLSVSGQGSEAAVANAGELRAALAGQGLSLGRIDLAPAAAAAAADLAGPRARNRSGDRAEGRAAKGERGDSQQASVNESSDAGLARALQ
jgi:hypothetical protein